MVAKKTGGKTCKSFTGKYGMFMGNYGMLMGCLRVWVIAGFPE